MALASMTGFGRGESSDFIVTIQSVNRKHLEIKFSLPGGLSSLELFLRKEISQSLSRGFLQVRVSFKEEGPLALHSSLASLRQLKKEWEERAVSLGYPKECIDLPFLLSQSGLKEFELSEEREASLKKALQEALSSLEKMKQNEGLFLQKELLERLGAIEEDLKKVSHLSSLFSSQMKEKMELKIKELLSGGVMPEERLIFEVALLVEKADISEEITRLFSHIEQFRSQLQTGKGPRGKSLEFLLQEMGREVNTMGSKGGDVSLSYLVIAMKGEIEKMKEQIQNVE